jgi:L-amino acid N-acyltransferase YncA
VLGSHEVEVLAHLPRALRRDLLAAVADSPVAGALSGGAPVSFCHAAAITETLWEVSVHTLDGYRRRGLATRAVHRLMAELRGEGWWPVCAVEDGDAPALAFARRLGFVESGRMAVFRQTGDGGR